MPSGINLSFERLSQCCRQVGCDVLLTRVPVAIHQKQALMMLPLDLYVLSL